MSGTMPIRERNAAWEALKRAATRCVEAEELLRRPLDADQRETAERWLREAKKRIVEIWDRFPECWGDSKASIPPAIAILQTIKRQEEAEEWAKILSPR